MTAGDNKKEKEKTARETLGKYFYDLSKTSFGTGLVGQVVPCFAKDEATGVTWKLFLFCLVATAGFAVMGNKILRGKLWNH